MGYRDPRDHVSMTIGERMRETAVEKWGPSAPLKTLSDRTGCSLPMLSKIANGGTQNPEVVSFLKIARALGVTPEWLATGEGEKWESGGLSQADREWLDIGRTLSDDQRRAARALFYSPEQRSDGNS